MKDIPWKNILWRKDIPMKKYISFFRLRLVMGLQYRAAALAGISTQFFWGFMEIIAFMAFYESDPSAYPMTLDETCSYVWLQQAFLVLLSARIYDGEILNAIQSGNIAYEFCRPIHIYDMWFAKSTATRLSGAWLRCIPVLLITAFLPKPYGLSAPKDLLHFVLFLFTLAMGLLVVVSFNMLVYVSGFYTISTDGAKILTGSVVDFFTGHLIPLPFFPEGIRQVLELLPFAAMQNVPLRIYSGNLAGAELHKAIILQIFWLVTLTACGKLLCHHAEKKVIVHGG